MIIRASPDRIRDLGNTRIKGLGSIKIKNLGTEIAPFQGTKTIGKTEEGRNLSEKEVKAGRPNIMILEMSQSSATSEPYSEVSEEKEKGARIGKPTLGTKSTGKFWQ